MNTPPTPLRDRIDGVLLLDKPLGLSSNDALVRARRLLGARKVGHGGTLDPLASGLLPLLFGEATKFALDSLDADKTYLAELVLGVTTETGDAEGRVLAQREPECDEAQLRESLLHFVGEIEQVPPMHSALKHQGRPLYEYARAGVVVERAARRVTIRSIELLRFAPPRAWLRVTCSKGTYVRSLAIDLGERLGCGAHLGGLRRERVGTVDVADAVTLDALEALEMSERRARLLPVDALLGGLPRLDLDAPLATRFLQGRKLRIALSGPGTPPDVGVPAGAPVPRIRVYGAGRLLGVALHESGELQPQRLVATDSPGRDAGPGKLR